MLQAIRRLLARSSCDGIPEGDHLRPRYGAGYERRSGRLESRRADETRRMGPTRASASRPISRASKATVRSRCMTTLTELSLFSGYGGFTLGLRLAGLDVRTIGYVEIDEHCQRIIGQRIEDGYLDRAPVVRDIRGADMRPMAGLVDILTAGFPCQPHSTAGRRQGARDERDLWPDTARTIGEVGPGVVVLENVNGLRTRSGQSPAYAWKVLADLAEMGYVGHAGVVSARDAGATQLRERWWVLAYSGREYEHLQQRPQRVREPTGKGRRLADSASQHADGDGGPIGSPESGGLGGRPVSPDVADSEGQRLDGSQQSRGRRSGPPGQSDGLADAGGSGLGEGQRDVRSGEPDPVGGFPPGPDDFAEWGRVLRAYPSLEPAIRRVADGRADRVGQLRALGNGIVPAVVAEFLRTRSGQKVT